MSRRAKRRARALEEEQQAVAAVTKAEFDTLLEAVKALREEVNELRKERSKKERSEGEASEKELDHESDGDEDEAENEEKERLGTPREAKTPKKAEKKAEKASKGKGEDKRVDDVEKGGRRDEVEGERNTDTRALSSIQTAFLKDVPKLKGGQRENPEEWLAFFEDVLRDARGPKGIEEAELERYILRVAQNSIEKGSEAEAWLKDYRARQGEERGEWRSFVSAFRDKFLAPEKRLEWNRSFLERRQGKEESPQKYLIELRDLARLAKKGETDILAQIKTGLEDEMSKALAPLRLKTLNEVEEAAQALWEEGRRKDEGKSQGKAVTTVMAVTAAPARGKAEENLCYGCGGKGHRRRECPSVKKRREEGEKEGFEGKERREKGKFYGECYNCGKKGHRARECTAPKKDTAIKTKDYKEEAEKEEQKSSFKATRSAKSELPFVEVTVGGVKETAMIDSGTDEGGLVDESLGNRLKWKVEPEDEEFELRGLMDGATARWGVAVINLGGKEVTLPVGVTRALNGKIPFLLGNEVLRKLGAIFDWEKLVITPKNGKSVPFSMSKVKGGAYGVYSVWSEREGRGIRVQSEGKVDREVKGKEKASVKWRKEEDPKEGKIGKEERISEERSKGKEKEKEEMWMKDKEGKEQRKEEMGKDKDKDKASVKEGELVKENAEASRAEVNEQEKAVNEKEKVSKARGQEAHKARQVEVKAEVKKMGHRKWHEGYWFKVEWADGDVTEERMVNFVDIVKGRKVWNSRISAYRYARRNGIPLERKAVGGW